MPSDGLAILSYLAFEVIVSLLTVVGVVVSSVGITAALVIVLYALARRVLGLRRGPGSGMIARSGTSSLSG